MPKIELDIDWSRHIWTVTFTGPGNKRGEGSAWLFLNAFIKAAVEWSASK